ncbi:MAG: hypothetical protein F4075_11415, partial [Acidobacteria bacterium]|nr:hypothetical protein [Gemmatimonadota bacterium]MYI97499.1 hypothetical protein [Acidobacteriota bacterium]
MTILRPVRLAHILLPTTRRSTQLGTSARILPVLAASLALTVGADPAQASIPFSPLASDTLRVTLSAPEGSMVAEGATGHFEVSVAGSTADGAVTIRYSVSGTAVAGEDYAALSGVVTVAQGESTARIALEAFEDGILDKGETVVLALTGATGPGTVVVDQTAATATIADDGSVTVSLTAVPDTISEGAAWSSTVTMSTPVADRVSVRWRTTDGTALAGRDYTAADEVLSFQPGETSKSISVQTLEDDNAEAVEVFYVSLDPPSISASAATIGALAVNGDARSVFIDCSIRFPPGVQTLFRLNDPVSAGTLVGTVTAEASAIADYFLTGGDNKFTINARGQIRTTAALDAGGFYELAVTAVDHCDAKASIDVTVIVNSSPQTVGTIPDGTVQVGGSGTVDVSPYFSDPDGNRLTYTASSSKPSVVSVNVSGSKVTYTGEAGGSASVTVTAKDPGGLSVNQSFTVSVNRPPKCKPIPAQEVREDKSVKVDLASLCTDPDGDNLAFEDPTTSDNRVATVGLDKNVLTINGVARGSATVGATVSDGNGGSTTTSGPVEVTRNEPPECNPIPSQTLDPGESVKVDLADLCIDPEKEGLRYGDEDSKDESVATVSLDGSELTITGVARGSTEVSATATDPHDESATAAGSATVPNSPPEQVGTIPGQSIDWGERGSVDVTSYFRDRDGDALKYTAVSSAPTIVSVGVSGSKVTYTGEAVGTATVTVTADDDNGGTAKQLFNVTVTNRSPTCDPIPRQTVDEGKSVAVDLAKLCSDEDPDDRLRYSDAKSTKPTVATVSLNGSVLTIEGVAGGDATVSAVATDLHNASATASGPVEVEEEVNRRPTARAGRDQRVEEGDLVKLDGSRSTDPDGTIERWLWTGPVKLTNPNSTKASFTAPEVDTTTAYTFTLQVWDDKDATDTDLMKVTVEPVDTTTCEAPRANAGRDRTVRELRRVTLDGSGSTGESSYAWKQVGGRTVTLSDADTATPWFDTPLVAADEVLTFRLTVTTDCDTTTDTDDVRVTIRDNRAPEPKGTIPAQPVWKGESGTVSVSGYFQDRDGDALTYTATSSATGVASVSVTGSTVKYTGKTVGSAQVTVTARDRYGATAKQEFRVTVTTPPPTNRAPVIESVIPARAVVAGDSVAVRVSPHFSDPDSDALTYSASSSNRN